MKNIIIFILTLFVIVSIYALKSESDKYKGYLQIIVNAIDTKQVKVNCKENEDPYFFSYNTVGSTSPKFADFEKEVIAIGVSCIDRITQEDKSSMSVVFQNPLLIDKPYYISGI